MNATVDNRPVTSMPGFQDYQRTAVVVLHQDFSASGNGLRENESMALLDVPGDTKVKCHVKVEVPDSDITAFSLGLSLDGSPDESLLSGASLAASGYVRGRDEVLIPGKRHLVFVNRTPGKVCNRAVIKVVAEMTELD
ncbi:MAG: hypothetical protein WCV67_07035 [Victivallaceae bacterium]